MLSSKYVECISNVSPDGNSERWLQLYQDTVLRYCVNPTFQLKSFFWYILETVRRCNVFEFDENTGEFECRFAGAQNKFVSTFLMSLLNLKKRLKQLYNTVEMLLYESCLFAGLTRYLQKMAPTIKAMEKFIADEDAASTANRQKKGVSEKKKVAAPKKETVVASSHVVSKNRLCVISPYGLDLIDEKAVNLYYFGEEKAPQAPNPFEVDEASLEGPLLEKDVDSLLRKYNPSYYATKVTPISSTTKPPSESQRAFEEEMVVKNKNNNNKKQKRKQVKKRKTTTTGKMTVETNDDKDLFIPVQILVEEDENLQLNFIDVQ